MTDTMPMWPVSDLRPPAPVLRQGDIVRNTRTGERGVVVSDPVKAGQRTWTPMWVGDVQIDVHGSPGGCTLVTNNGHREWAHVPEREQTAEERVRRTRYQWRPITMRSPEEVAESGEADDDTMAWHLLYALLPVDVAEKITNGYDEWPSTYALARRLAELLDVTSERVS